MQHRKRGRKFHRIASKRAPFLRNLVNNLVRHESIETTEARAKEIRPQVEKLVTMGKKQTLAARRLLIQRLHNERMAHKVFEVLSPRYADRKGGYLRIKKSAKVRRRDASVLVTIEFV
ncbi:MAG: 50S ribosomal protein L17 [Patescibacteria group bacterium]